VDLSILWGDLCSPVFETLSSIGDLQTGFMFCLQPWFEQRKFCMGLCDGAFSRVMVCSPVLIFGNTSGFVDLPVHNAACISCRLYFLPAFEG
jgi:hypothetical protein